MASAAKVLQINQILAPDLLAQKIANVWLEWDSYKNDIKLKWREIRQYLNATDTSYTSNNRLPWNNKTTIPKLTQISDNLSANYMASMFPKRRWLVWQSENADDAKADKANSIRDYMSWVIDQQWYKDTVQTLVNDYIQSGNCFSMPEWVDERVQLKDRTQVGYVGPKLVRINPLDIVFNPTAPSFAETPKIIRSMVSMGEAKEKLMQMSLTDGDKEITEALFKRMLEYRNVAVDLDTSDTAIQDLYRMEGFGNFRNYLESGYVEVLTFYGDLYDRQNDTFYKNYQIVVMDRSQLAYKKPNPSYFGRAPIYHSGWRTRPDNLWAMGPLDNLVGMQYRIDHVENMGADIFDLTAFPPFKIKGIVEDFEWGPLEEIVVDKDGDVEMMSPKIDYKAYQDQLERYLALMEEMAGAPKEAMGFRTPGEKTMYEVQSLENAAGRIFQAKINQIEEQQIEPGLNAMLELARRNMDPTVVRVMDDEWKIEVFKTLSPTDITGTGRIKPMAARHFAETAQRLQNITGLFNSKLGQMILPHTSTVKLAALADSLLELEDWKIFQPNIAVSEQADQQKLANAAQEEVQAQAATPAGIVPGDQPMGPKSPSRAMQKPGAGGQGQLPQPQPGATPPPTAPIANGR